MTPAQLTETVGLAVKHYGHFKPEDFKLCHENVKLGKYGQLFDRIDGQVILGFYKAYDLERDYIATEIASNQNEERKMADKQLLLPQEGTVSADADEVYRRNMAKLKETLANNRIAKAKAMAPAEKPTNPVYEMSQRWIQQFDELHYLRPVKVKQFRFIRRYGRTMDINEYLQHKHWQWFTFNNPVIRADYREKYLNK